MSVWQARRRSAIGSGNSPDGFAQNYLPASLDDSALLRGKWCKHAAWRGCVHRAADETVADQRLRRSTPATTCLRRRRECAGLAQNPPVSDRIHRVPGDVREVPATQDRVESAHICAGHAHMQRGYAIYCELCRSVPLTIRPPLFTCTVATRQALMPNACIIGPYGRSLFALHQRLPLIPGASMQLCAPAEAAVPLTSSPVRG